MNKYLGHLKTITVHKWYVGVECFKCGLYWQGITHDLSKYSPVEFLNSAKYWTGNGSPIPREKRDRGYSEAWLHHKGRNKHHWDYWVDFGEGGTPILTDIPDKYILEMACDMIGAAKAYGTNDPYGYYLASRNSMLMTLKNAIRLENLLDEASK